jgi:diaminopimelate decarboxylase
MKHVAPPPVLGWLVSGDCARSAGGSRTSVARWGRPPRLGRATLINRDRPDPGSIVSTDGSVSLPPEMERVLPPSSRVEGGHLLIGGCDTVELADRFGTPLYVYDEAALEHGCRDFAAAMASGPPGSRGLYALKAFPAVAMARIASEAGLGILCASGGEVAVADAARVPEGSRVLHGNNKSEEELGAPVGRLVVDSFDEIGRLERLAPGRPAAERSVWLRVTPGLDAGGHEFIRTGGVDSKFGVGLGDALEAAVRLAGVPGLHLTGLHAHVGSQLFGVEEHLELARLMSSFLQEACEATGQGLTELDLGGGFAVAHIRDDPPALAPAEAATEILRAVPPHISVVLEPGRALVGRAGISLHRIGTVKTIPRVRTYVSVDGGMSDNIRPALYGARYEFCLAGRTGQPAEQTVRIVGKHCESGDVLAAEARLPADPRPGEVLVTAATGAYAWAMASNYNQIPRPAVAFCRDGQARIVVRRETAQDLLHLQQR